MRVLLVCVGRVKERFTRDWLAEFEKRLSKYASFEVVELRESSKDQESPEILRRLKQDDVVFLFDSRGEQLSSEEFARLISRQEAKRLVLLIGGPAGVADDVRRRANHMISISRMTFTHQIARLLVTEQLYRAFTILKGEKYHK